MKDIIVRMKKRDYEHAAFAISVAMLLVLAFSACTGMETTDGDGTPFPK